MSNAYTPRTWVVGEVVTAAYMNTEIRDFSTGLQAAWTAWTPTVASGITVGNGTWTGAYDRQGRSIRARFSFTFGSSSSFTTPVLVFPPIAVSASYVVLENVGSGTCYDVSAGTAGRWGATLFVTSTSASTYGTFALSTNGPQVTNASPMTWATGDILSGTLSYEAA